MSTSRLMLILSSKLAEYSITWWGTTCGEFRWALKNVNMLNILSSAIDLQAVRFLSFTHSGKPSFGAVVGSGIVDLGQKFRELANLRDAIYSDELPFLSRHGKFNVTQGKNFEKSGALGPWLVTASELNPFDNLHIMTRVNGEERQNDVTANLLFSFRYLISYLSTFFRLRPGDIIATGTPNGAGARFNPPKFLTSGDVVEVEVPGIGTLTNPVVTEDL